METHDALQGHLSYAYVEQRRQRGGKKKRKKEKKRNSDWKKHHRAGNLNPLKPHGCLTSLDAAGIHEHSDSAAQRRGREVAPESGADNATATVGAGHLAPNNTELGSILLGLGLVNVSQPLSKVPVNFLRCVHTFDLEERGAGVLVRFRPASPEMNY